MTGGGVIKVWFNGLGVNIGGQAGLGWDYPGRAARMNCNRPFVGRRPAGISTRIGMVFSGFLRAINGTEHK